MAPQVELAHWGITESWQSFGAWESGKNPRISDTACLVKTQQKRRDTSSANFLGGGYVWVEIEIVVIMRLRLPRFILWFPSFSQLSTSQTLWPRHLGHSQDVRYGGSGEIGDHSPMPWLTRCYACAPGPRRWKDVQIAADSKQKVAQVHRKKCIGKEKNELTEEGKEWW